MLLKSEERKANEVLFGSDDMHVDPILRGSRFKICQSSTALREHEGYSVPTVESDYELARAAYVEPLQTWKSVREELQTFKSLVPSLEANLRLPWSEVCYSTDASLTGGLFTLRSASVHDVISHRSLAGKRRLHCQGEAVRPREPALSVRKTGHPETFKDDDDDDPLELLRHPRAIPSGFEFGKERGACSPWAQGGVVRREGDEYGPVAFLDQDVCRLLQLGFR